MCSRNTDEKIPFTNFQSWHSHLDWSSCLSDPRLLPSSHQACIERGVETEQRRRRRWRPAKIVSIRISTEALSQTYICSVRNDIESHLSSPLVSSSKNHRQKPEDPANNSWERKELLVRTSIICCQAEIAEQGCPIGEADTVRDQYVTSELAPNLHGTTQPPLSNFSI